MSATIFLNSSVKYVPQMDMVIKYTENGGIEGSQTFIARKADLGAGAGSNLSLFTRGTRWDAIFPEIPAMYGGLTMKTFDPKDGQPGLIEILGTFTGYQYSSSGGSSGEEQSVPTSTLRANEDQASIIYHKKWKALTDISKRRLGWLMNNPVVSFNVVSSEYGKLDEDGEFTAFPTELGIWAVPTGDELEFARAIAEGDTSYKMPSWTYEYRTESRTGFTAPQLNTAFKIVENPPGDPVKHSNDYTWLCLGPDQSQSGPHRFVKNLMFQLIPDNERNQLFYGP